MDRHLTDEDDEALPPGLPPQDVWADCLAGLDDIKHGRTVSVDLVLADLDAKLAAWKAEKSKADRDGDDHAHRSTAD